MPLTSRVPDPLDREKPGVKVRANATERKLAKRLGGRAQPASGALSGFKGDVRTRRFLIDSKETEGVSIRVTAEMLAKITREAEGEGRDPALMLKIGGKQWAVVPIEVFEDMNEKEV